MLAFKNKICFVLILIMAALIAVSIFTWPLALKISSYYQESSDWALNSWILWYSQQSILSGKIFDLGAYFNAPQFYPSSFALAFSEHLLIPSLLFMPIYQFTHNLIISINIFIFLTFILSFLAAFYFIDHFLKDKLSAFIGALFYTFNPYIAEHLFAGHLQLLSRFFLPLLFLFGIEYFIKPNKKYALLFITLFTLNSLSGIYFQNFSLVGLGVIFFVIVAFKHNKDMYPYIKELTKFSLIFIPFLLVIFYFEYFYLQFSYLESAKRGIIDNLKLSARLFDWLFTLPQSRLYGSFVESWSHFRGADSGGGFYFYPERVVFPTITAIILFLFSLLGILKKSIVVERMIFVSLLFLLVVSGLLSLGPSVYIYHGFTLSNHLYNFLYQLGPLLQGTRVPARFVFIFYIPFSFLIALGFLQIRRVIKTLPYPKLLTFIILSITLFAWYAENSVNLQWSEQSKTIKSIRYYQSNNESVIKLIAGKKTIHYPLYIEDPRYNAKYLTWSIYTGETLFNGYSGFAPREWVQLAKQVVSLQNENTYKILKAIDVDFIVIHKDEYNLNDPTFLRTSFIENMISFEDNNLLILNLDKLPSLPICSYDPVTKIFVDKSQNIIFKNTENCYFVAKYQNKYIKFTPGLKLPNSQVNLRLPIVVQPNEEVNLSN